jgi:hypothetical protein
VAPEELLADGGGLGWPARAESLPRSLQATASPAVNAAASSSAGIIQPRSSASGEGSPYGSRLLPCELHDQAGTEDAALGDGTMPASAGRSR